LRQVIHFAGVRRFGEAEGGDFRICEVSKPETLTLTVSGKGTGSGTTKGTMAFDGKDYGMTMGIPFIRIADRVEVTVDLKGKRVSGLRWSLSTRQPATFPVAAAATRIMEYGGGRNRERGEPKRQVIVGLP
jgi:hypothetical protein